MAKNETTPTTNTCRCWVRNLDYFGGEDELGNNDETHWVYDIGCFTPIGARSKFAQGHDAKLKSELIRAHRAGVEIGYLEGGTLVTSSPYEVALQMGWERFITDAKPKAPRKAPKVTDDLPRGLKVEVSYRNSPVQGRIEESDEEGFYLVRGKTKAGKSFERAYKRCDILVVGE